MSANAVSQIVGQIQYLGMLQELDVPWPDNMEEILNVLSFANLDFRKIITTSEFPVIDFRIMYIIFAVILPIAICIATLLLFASPLDVLLFCSLSTGAMLFISWLFSYIFTNVDSFSSNQVLFAGIALMSVPVIIIISRIVYAKVSDYLDERAGKKKKLDEVGDHMRKMRMQERKFHRRIVFKFTMYGFTCLFICLFLMGLFDAPVDVGNAGFWAGVGFAAASLCSFIMVGMLSFDRTRRAIQTVTEIIQRYGLMLIISAITASFVPAMTYSSTTFLCTTYTCRTLTKFNPTAYRKLGNYSTSQDLYCDPCQFYITDKCNQGNASALCPAMNSYRNWREPDVPCDDAPQGLFYASAAIVLIVYIISIPTLFFIIIRELTDAIAERVQLEEPQDTNHPEEDDRENWRRKLMLVQPTAATLYEAYSFRQRYFSLIVLLHRLLVTIAVVIIGPLMTDVSVPVVLVLHSAMLIFVVCLRPYLRGLEHTLGVLLALCNVFNALFVLGYRYDVLPNDTGLTVLFMLVNFALPPLFIGIMMFVAFKRAGVIENVRRRASVKNRTSDDEELEEDNTEQQKRYEDTKDADKNKMEQLALDRSTQNRILTRCFIFIGVFFFIALTAALIGVLSQETSPYRTVTSPLHQGIDYTLGPYASWSDMTDNCCCMLSKNPSEDYTVMERWVCNSGITFNRGRVSSGGLHNGTAVRDLCGTQPKIKACSITIVNNQLQMVCPTVTREALLSSGTISKYAYDYYF